MAVSRTDAKRLTAIVTLIVSYDLNQPRFCGIRCELYLGQEG